MLWTPKGIGLALLGNVAIKVGKPGVHIPDLETFQKNKLVNGGRELIAKILGTLGGYDAGIPYLAVGKSGIAPDRTDTHLYDEYYRNIMSVSFEDGTLLFGALLNNGEANLTAPDELKELGVFWDGATGDPGTGTLFARVLMRPSFTKTESEEVEVYWSYRVVEAYEDLAER